jgi:hypothetical protein
MTDTRAEAQALLAAQVEHDIPAVHDLDDATLRTAVVATWVASIAASPATTCDVEAAIVDRLFPAHQRVNDLVRSFVDFASLDLPIDQTSRSLPHPARHRQALDLPARRPASSPTSGTT